MFLNYLKDFFTKKIVKNTLSNVKNISSDTTIKTVGIVFDETYFYEKEALIHELVKNGILESCLTTAYHFTSQLLKITFFLFLNHSDRNRPLSLAITTNLSNHFIITSPIQNFCLCYLFCHFSLYI